MKEALPKRITIRLRSVGRDLTTIQDAMAILDKLNRFEEVILDFEGITSIGAEFAKGVFEVWKTSHPETRLVPTNMSSNIEAYAKRASRL